MVISNHADLEGVAANFGVPFRCFPLAKGAGPDAKSAQVLACDARLFIRALSLAA